MTLLLLEDGKTRMSPATDEDDDCVRAMLPLALRTHLSRAAACIQGSRVLGHLTIRDRTRYRVIRTVGSEVGP